MCSSDLKAVKALGGVDILINCAGGAYRGRLEQIPDAAWERYFAVKPLGLIRMTREALPHLKKSPQGRVINISGTRGREPGGPSVMSGPINLGTLSITKALANEFGPYGITVNAICPGFFPSKMTKATLDATGETMRELTPTRRLGNDEDLQGLAVLLASEASRHITGQAIAVDGGATLI